MRLVDYRRMHWQNRAHFLAVSAQATRRILVDRARRRNAKRGADVAHVSVDAEAVLCTDRSGDFESLDNALTALAERAPRKAKVASTSRRVHMLTTARSRRMHGCRIPWRTLS
jgi:hypothetical protein